jgi:hypothetical protein
MGKRGGTTMPKLTPEELEATRKAAADGWSGLLRIAGTFAAIGLVVLFMHGLNWLAGGNKTVFWLLFWGVAGFLILVVIPKEEWSLDEETKTVVGLLLFVAAALALLFGGVQFVKWAWGA